MSKNMNVLSCLLWLNFTLVPSFCLSAEANGMQNLGSLPGSTFSIGNGVSGDGKTVVGIGYTNSVSPDGRAFSWTQTNGMTSLGVLNKGNWSNALAVSHNGSIIVGQAANGARGQMATAFIWTASNGIVELVLPNPGPSSANGVNADGSVIVGQAGFNVGSAIFQRAFYQANGAGPESLGVIAGTTSNALGVSADGKVVVGHSTYTNLLPSPPLLTHAFRWTQATEMEDLGTLPGGNNSWASATNADGSVVVGSSNTTIGGPINRAFRWTRASNMVNLNTLPGGTLSVARGVSADGLVVVGQADVAPAIGPTHRRAVRWTAATGFQTIEQWLAEAGVDSSGIPTTLDANAVNEDGSVVVGKLQSNHAFIARVNPAMGSGMVAVPDLYHSLESTASALTLASNSTGLVLHGSHSHPLDNRIDDGSNGFWLTGDWGYFKNKKLTDQRGPNALAELGFAHLFNDYFQAGVGAGRTSSTQHLMSNSRLVVNGSYFIAETLAKLPCDLWVTLTGYYLVAGAK